jgi:chemotaxis-related protein WspB
MSTLSTDTNGCRMLTFEIGGAAYALPIADVIEVSEVARTACIPTLPQKVAGVVNHHGDALPVVSRALLFGLDDAALPPPEHLLVVGDGGAESGRLGLPVDRVLGLASVDEALPRSTTLISARRPLAGRIVHILCTDRLLARAAQAIEQAVDRSAGRGQPGQGGSA